jgi:hypothetical protein
MLLNYPALLPTGTVSACEESSWLVDPARGCTRSLEA